jgi:hypothetical protein
VQEVVQRCLAAMGRETLRDLVRYSDGLKRYTARLGLIDRRLHERLTRQVTNHLHLHLLYDTPHSRHTTRTARRTRHATRHMQQAAGAGGGGAKVEVADEAGGGKLEDVELTEADMEDVTGGASGGTTRRRKRENDDDDITGHNNNEDEDAQDQAAQPMEEAAQDMVGDSLAPFIFT